MFSPKESSFLYQDHHFPNFPHCKYQLQFNPKNKFKSHLTLKTPFPAILHTCIQLFRKGRTNFSNDIAPSTPWPPSLKKEIFSPTKSTGCAQQTSRASVLNFKKALCVRFLELDLRTSFDYKSPSSHQKKLLFNRNVTENLLEKRLHKRRGLSQKWIAHKWGWNGCGIVLLLKECHYGLVGFVWFEWCSVRNWSWGIVSTGLVLAWN